MGRTYRRREQRRLNEHISVGATDESNSSGGENFVPSLHKYMNAKGWRNETQLSVRDFPRTGRGLHSKRRQFAAGDELIRLPFECLITLNSIEADDEFRALFDADRFTGESIGISFQALLAFYLLHHQRLGPTSPIARYLQSLPAQYTTPYFCPSAELQHLPEAILERTVAQNRKIRDCYLNLKAVSAFTDTHFHELFTLADFRRAYFAVNTRSVYLEPTVLLPHAQRFFRDLLCDEPTLALAPFLDLFNHSDTVQTKAKLMPNRAQPDKLDFVICLEQAPVLPLRPYKQLFISYGALPNHKLLIDYGFYVEYNKHDYFEFSLQDVQNLIKCDKSLSTHRNIFKYIRDHNLADNMFVHLVDGCSHNLKVVLHLLLKQRHYLPNVLDQIAYGEAKQFEDVYDVLGKLIAYKIAEYQGYVNALLELPTLSPSGTVAANYMIECINHLEAFESSHCPVDTTMELLNAYT